MIQHPEEMNRETLYDLRALLALYPYYQTARLLMLQNLYILHDTCFDEELRRAAIYITDRRIVFQMIEAAHYKLRKTENKAANLSSESTSVNKTTDNSTDRTSSLIDNFLHAIPMDNKPEDEATTKKKEKRKPTPADAAVDYVAYLIDTEDQEEEEKPSRTISLIDDFIEDGGFKLPKMQSGEDYKPEYTPQIEEESSNCIDEQTENSGVFTETLARIYIKQGKYKRAHQIIECLSKQHPHKSMYYIDQLRFLEKLILNNKKNKEKK